MVSYKVLWTIVVIFGLYGAYEANGFYVRSWLPARGRTLSATNGEIDTVVARCTRKISESLNPVKISVTSSDDDPNGSHVCHILHILRYNVPLLHFTYISIYYNHYSYTNISFIWWPQIQIVCISSEFEGKNSVQRQRLVYKAIWDELSGPVHAVDNVIAKTPAEVGLWVICFKNWIAV